MDKEYIVLNEIEKNPRVTQRDLSHKAQISLGSVNLLINKMVKEGFVKINQIPMNRVVYMLTPKGIVEKVNKTGAYIKHHYNYINETKEKIREQAMKLSLEYQKLYVVLEDDEISELVKLATSDLKGVHYVDTISEDMEELEGIVIVTTSKVIDGLGDGIRVVNLLECL